MVGAYFRGMNKPDKLKQLGKRERVLRHNLNSTISREQREHYTNELRQVLDERRTLCTQLDIRKVTLT